MFLTENWLLCFPRVSRTLSNPVDQMQLESCFCPHQTYQTFLEQKHTKSKLSTTCKIKTANYDSQVSRFVGRWNCWGFTVDPWGSSYLPWSKDYKMISPMKYMEVHLRAVDIGRLNHLRLVGFEPQIWTVSYCYRLHHIRPYLVRRFPEI